MPFYIATMSHPDGNGWDAHLAEHMEYLKSLLRAGQLRASGPVKGLGLRAGFLIFQAGSGDEVADLIAQDPFSLNGLIVSLSIHEWDPLIGQFHDDSSKALPAWGETADASWRMPSGCPPDPGHFPGQHGKAATFR